MCPETRVLTLADRLKRLLRALLVRATLLIAGCTTVSFAIWLNFNAGSEILAGLLSPEDPLTLVLSLTRLLVPALGLWLIYRALR